MRNLSLVILAVICGASCGDRAPKAHSESINEIDSCRNAVVYPLAKATEQGVTPYFTGELNNYWGDDTTKLDFTHIFKNGKLIESRFYYENGSVNEKYTFKCQALHGTIEFFYENGQLGQVIPYEYGRRNGIGRKFDSLGNETSRVRFKNDSIVDDFNQEK